MNGDPTVFGEFKQRLRHAEDKLVEIKGELRELNLSVKELNNTVYNFGKPKWQLLLGGASLLCLVTGSIWGLAISPLNDRIKSLEFSSVPREVHIEKWAQTKEEFQRVENEIAQKVSKDDLNRLIIDIDQRLAKRK